MKYSAELLATLKAAGKYKNFKAIANDLPCSTPSIISEVKSGKRHLTEEQALWIADKLEIDPKWVLINLAEEKASCERSKQVWREISS